MGLLLLLKTNSALATRDGAAIAFVKLTGLKD